MPSALSIANLVSLVQEAGQAAGGAPQDAAESAPFPWIMVGIGVVLVLLLVVVLLRRLF